MNAAILPRLAVVVLAAGLSSRLGRPKALIKIGSLSVLRRSLTLAAGLTSSPVILVIPPRAGRYRSEVRDLRVMAIANPERASGLSTSVRRAVHAARFSSGILFLPVDLALLSPRDLARLHRRWLGGRRRLVARSLPGLGKNGPRAGSPLILPKRLYWRARELLGDSGLRQIIAELPPQELVRVNLPSAEIDIDTAADVNLARRRWRRTRAADQ